MFVIFICHEHLRRLSNHWVRVSDLNDGCSSRDGVVSDTILAGSQDNVALAVEPSGTVTSKPPSTGVTSA
jgi:hypothetical protein